MIGDGLGFGAWTRSWPWRASGRCVGTLDRPVPDATVRRILEAGRIAGSSRNRQPWRFLVVGDPGVRERVAEAVFAPGNVRGAALVVVAAVRGGGPVGLEEDERPVIVLTFGYRAGARDPQRRSPEEWVAGPDRKTFEEVVRRL
jgi:nitroreductase